MTAVIKCQADNLTKCHILYLPVVFCFPILILKLYRMMCVQTARYLMGDTGLLLHSHLAY